MVKENKRLLQKNSRTPHERYLWISSVLLFGIGDAVTTLVGIYCGAIEGGPLTGLAVTAVGHVPAMFITKTVVFVALWLLSRVIPYPERIGIPLGLTLLGAAIVGWNLVIIVILLGFE